ncbi:MD-2-related lipid-recognition domain [Dillenia turbinata]|uniref:MD-2-related lipid-recognition domain n=1 Tax=Dillenia turbinata TaxID=194707 RepID=A0AAN8W6G8_9MAGN
MEAIQLKLILSLFVSLLLLASSTLAVNVDYCDKSASYDVKVQGVEISPNPVARGKPATFSISASTDEAISRGKLVIDVSSFGVHIHTETHDLCSETSCPVFANDFLNAHFQVLPRFTPPGSYTLTMKMEDENKNLLTCIGFGFQIGFATDVADS